MKAVSYIALALSVIALALGIYAVSGGFSGAGTAIGVPITSTSTLGTSSTRTTGTVQSSTDLKLTKLTTGSKEISVKAINGTELAKITVVPLVNTDMAGRTSMRGWNVTKVVVTDAGVVTFKTDFAPKITTPLSATSDTATVVAFEAAVRNIVYVTVDMNSLKTALLAAADALAKDTVLKGVTGWETSSDILISDSSTTLTAAGLSATEQDLFKTVLTAIAGGTTCESASRCGTGTQGQL